MNQEDNLSKRILLARQNIDEADRLIYDYLPFIKKETAKVTGKIPVKGKDDELSVALMGFHEAIEGYSDDKGSFVNFASVVIRHRLIDFIRRENNFANHVELKSNPFDEKNQKAVYVTDDELENRTAMKWEIQRLAEDLQKLGISISEVAANCPKYEKTISSCREVTAHLISHPEYMEDLIESGKLPTKRLTKETSINRKTLERHRKYVIALALIYYQNYECIISHLSEVYKKEEGGK